VDASFVDVPRQRNSRAENATIKAGGVPEAWAEQPPKQQQKDVDARWTKKNAEVHYGYKNHVKADAKSKLIERYASHSHYDPACGGRGGVLKVGFRANGGVPRFVTGCHTIVTCTFGPVPALLGA